MFHALEEIPGRKWDEYEGDGLEEPEDHVINFTLVKFDRKQPLVPLLIIAAAKGSKDDPTGDERCAHPLGKLYCQVEQFPMFAQQRDFKLGFVPEGFSQLRWSGPSDEVLENPKITMLLKGFKSFNGFKTIQPRLPKVGLRYMHVKSARCQTCGSEIRRQDTSRETLSGYRSYQEFAVSSCCDDAWTIGPQESIGGHVIYYDRSSTLRKNQQFEFAGPFFKEKANWGIFKRDHAKSIFAELHKSVLKFYSFQDRVLPDTWNELCLPKEELLCFNRSRLEVWMDMLWASLSSALQEFEKVNRGQRKITEFFPRKLS
jgi:hypothetical protein